MNEKEPPAALISALTTEHFVLQSALSSNTSEVGTRASLYLFSLSSSLVALGFASRSPELFVPFVAIVLPALFILGLFTVVRLVDSNLEGDSVSDRDRPHPPILSEAEPRRGGSLPWGRRSHEDAPLRSQYCAGADPRLQQLPVALESDPVPRIHRGFREFRVSVVN